MTAAELLREHGLHPPDTAPGRYYTTCPRCSASRSKPHRANKVLGITIDDKGVQWGCNHCAWTGGASFNGRANGHAPGSGFAGTHDYADANGVVRFQKVRNLPGREPRFWLRRPDGNDGWITGTKNVDTSLLYRLPEVIEAIANGYTIAIAEGEKDCDNLWRIGVPATCNAHGAADASKKQKPKWTAAHSEQLRGADIVILNDNDPSGRAHAEAAARMSLGIATRVRHLDLAQHWPSMPEKADVSDWIAAGYTREKLDALIENAPEAFADADAPELGNHSNGGLVFERMDAMQPEPIDWIWPGYLARGKLTLLAGDPGVGKSQISLDVAGRITCGGQWPDGTPAPRGSVILLTAEDAAADTVRPRLEAVGADLTRVHRLKSVMIGGKVNTFSLQRDLLALGDKVKELGDATMVVIDPITSYLGAELDSHRTSSVRAVLEPLAEWAETHKVGVLGITHPPKAAQAKAMHAITGSLAFVAAARLVFIAVEEPESERRLLLAVKNNLGALAPGLGYRLAQTIIGKDIVSSYAAWDNLPVTITANEAVRTQPDDKSALREAEDFLREELAEGSKKASTIKKAAADAGLSWATVRRAQERLNIKPKKMGLTKGWEWELPLNWHNHVREDARR